MTMVLRSVFVDGETEDKINRLAFFLRCSKNELMEWALKYALPVIDELAAKAVDKEKFAKEFTAEQINSKFAKELRKRFRADVKRLQAAIIDESEVTDE